MVRGVPHVCVRIRFGGKEAPVWLLVDTGAARTTLFNRAVEALGLSRGALEPAHAPMLGIGGPINAFLLWHVELVFDSSEGGYPLHRDLCVVLHRVAHLPLPLASRVLDLPSILGRDVIDGFRFVYERATGTVLLER